jgi:hypothetical protein
VNRPINWPPINFTNLEELRLSIWTIPGFHSVRDHPLLRSVASPRLQRVIFETGGSAPGLNLDEALVDLVERHKAHGKLSVQISTAEPLEYIRGSLPQLARLGVLEVYNSEP